MAATPQRAERIAYGAADQRRVVLLLTLAYTLNAADRTLIAIIGQPLKVDLNLSDAKLGLLIGSAFAMLYAFSGLAIARLAERVNRVGLIVVCLTAWSLLTALCGVAASFPQLLLIRMGVGVAEAGCTPPAHSLIADYVGPARRSTALSVYSCGISLGYIFSALIGGYLALHYGWRTACVVIGLPGILVAVLIRRGVREPPRGNCEAPSWTPSPVTARPWRGAEEGAELLGVLRSLFCHWPVANIVIGITIATFAAQGSYAFVPAYFNRAFDLDYATIGVVSALSGGVAVGIGLAAGGWITDALGRRSARWYALVPALGLLIATPLYVLAFLQARWQASGVLLALAAFSYYLSFGPTFGVVQNVMDPHRRATATAVIYVLLTVIGLGCGPPFTGWLIDRFAEFNFGHPGSGTVVDSFRAMRAAPAAGGTSFRSSCAYAGGLLAPTVKAGCSAALALASRQGLIVTVLLYAWAGLHYVVGARGLAGRLRIDRP